MIVRSVGAFAPGLAATLEGFNAKLAVMLLAAFIVTTHDPVPVQVPPQPVKLEPLAGVALKVTLEALLKVAVQVVPQLMPAGLLEMVPVPVPFFVRLSANVEDTAVLKVAVTDFAAFTVTVQVKVVPVQAPPQAAKLEPPLADAVNVRLEPPLKVAVQVAPQSIPAGLLETEPVPVPFLVMVSANVVGAIRLNVAVTDFTASIVTSQVNAVPVQAPLQPAKLEPLMIEAVNFTMVFWLNEALQIGSQLIPAGLLETLPDPDPALLTVKAKVFAGAVLKVAVTVCAALMLTSQDAAVLLQAPLQPAKTLPLAGAAISVMFDPLAKFAVQVVPQLIPAMVLETAPEPVPFFVTLRAKVV